MPRYLLMQKPAASGAWVVPDTEYDSGEELLRYGDVLTLGDGFEWRVVEFVLTAPEPYHAIALITRV